MGGSFPLVPYWFYPPPPPPPRNSDLITVPFDSAIIIDDWVEIGVSGENEKYVLL